jgi:hypothetical protein
MMLALQSASYKKHFLLFCTLALTTVSLFAHQQPTDTLSLDSISDEHPPYQIQALNVNGTPISISGFPDEPVWQKADLITNFTQRSPDIGAPASEKSEVRVMYDDNSIYISAILYDSAPDSIAAPLFRRDGNGYSDWFHVGIDSYNDQRTAFVFALNPKGVQKDLLIYDNNKEDVSWDAVWESAVTIFDEGWALEMRIPLSQIRYNLSDAGEVNEWGINFSRYIARKDETAYWSPTPPDDPAIVSRFGRLTNLENLSASRQLEVVPYVSLQTDRNPASEGNPFQNEYETSFNAGGDIKYGISSNLTLTATINPDFGQVEADPAEVNLSAFETFQSERRPFFLEGAEIFDFNINSMLNLGMPPQLFYSRRIGRSPQGSLPGNAVHTDIPGQTPITGAVKLSGKTQDGWSVGLLNALTREQTAQYTLPDGSIESMPVEPLTNYSTGRLQKDFRSGQSVVGMIANSMIRNNSVPAFTELLADQAYTGGINFQHQWGDRKYRFDGYFAGSHVSGSPEMITALQQTSARYQQRPDANHLSLDPDRSTLQGTYADVMLTRSTRHWVAQVRGYQISPGFEINDMGFQTNADRRSFTGMMIYRQPQSSLSWLRNYNAFLATGHTYNTDGDYIDNLHGIGGHARFNNFWSINFERLFSFESLDDRLTRGGPLAVKPARNIYNINVSTDHRKSVQLWFYAGYHNDNMGGEMRTGGFNLTYRPHPAANISIMPSFNNYKSTTQYAGTVETDAKPETFNRRYLFADLHQQTLSTTVRIDWTFSPTLSLQLYAQPFISSGEFNRFKELDSPGSKQYNVYGEDTGSVEYNPETNRYDIIPAEGSSESFSIANRDFNIRSLRGNAVVRWEYRPGSTLFFVWQQTRRSIGDQSSLNLQNDYGELFRTPAHHTFMVKFSYWLGS